MPKHHLISLEEGQLRNPSSDKDEFLRNVGAAVVLACLEPDADTIAINHPDGDRKGEPIITVRHLMEHKHEDVEVWVFVSGDEVGIADLSPSQLKFLKEIVEIRQQAQ